MIDNSTTAGHLTEKLLVEVCTIDERTIAILNPGKVTGEDVQDSIVEYLSSISLKPEKRREGLCRIITVHTGGGIGGTLYITIALRGDGGIEIRFNVL